MADDKKEESLLNYRRRVRGLWDDSRSYRMHWDEIRQIFLPRRGMYLSKDTEDQSQAGARKDQKIINGSAGDALRVVAAGLQGGMTSPSRPWLMFGLADSDLAEFGPVKEWLHDVRNILLRMFARSNFYPSTHNTYYELAGFGTGCGLMEEDFTTGMRVRQFTIGEYVLTLDSSYRVNGLYRKFPITAEQMVQAFGINNVSAAVRSCYQGASKDKVFEVYHCVHPQTMIDPSKADYRGMQFASNYYEANTTEDKFLRKAGYRGMPFFAPRWNVVGVNTWGDSPCMDALGDGKMLQKLEEKKLKKMDKHVDPPMNAPVALKAKGGTIISGGVNYLDVAQGQQSFVPAYQVDGNIQAVAMEIEKVETRIRRFLYNDLFMTIIQQDKQMTAEEVAKRYEEKLLMLGPVLERLQSEMLDPIVDRAFFIASNLGMLPPPPRELQGQEIKTEYIGLLSQAQKMVAMAPIQQVVGFVGMIAPIKPDVADKIDFDQAVDEFATAAGVAPRVIVADDKVAEIRASRAQQQQALQSQQTMIEGAGAVEKLAKSKTAKGDSVLDKVLAARGQQ